MTSERPGTSLHPSPSHTWRAFWLSPLLPACVVIYCYENIGMGIYALVFSYLFILFFAIPLFSYLRRRVKVSFLTAALSGAFLGTLLPFLFFVLSRRFESTLIVSYAIDYGFFDLLFGAIFGASIGSIFWLLSTTKIESADYKPIGVLAALIFTAPLTLPYVTGIVWDKLIKAEPPPLGSVAENTFKFSNYTPDHANATIKPHDQQALALKSALEKIFPLGTPFETIDGFIGREKSAAFSEGSSHYFRAHSFPFYKCRVTNWIMTVEYDKKKKVKNLILSARDNCKNIVSF